MSTTNIITNINDGAYYLKISVWLLLGLGLENFSFC